MFKFCSFAVTFFLLMMQSEWLKAETYSNNYTTDSALYKTTIDKIIDAFNLQKADRWLVEESALLFIYTGPCEGKRANPEKAFDVAQFMLGGGSLSKERIATYAIIGALSAKSLGRGPTPHLCRFAFETVHNGKTYVD